MTKETPKSIETDELIGIRVLRGPQNNDESPNINEVAKAITSDLKGELIKENSAEIKIPLSSLQKEAKSINHFLKKHNLNIEGITEKDQKIISQLFKVKKRIGQILGRFF